MYNVIASLYTSEFIEGAIENLRFVQTLSKLKRNVYILFISFIRL